MVRIKGGMTTRRRHKKVLKQAKGYWMTRHKQFKKAKEAVLHAGQYAFAGRKDKKRDFRNLWVIRINTALSPLKIKYNRFIHNLKLKKIQLDRKMLAKIAVEHPKVFEKIVEKVTQIKH